MKDERICANPSCNKVITLCFGAVKASDFLLAMEGKAKFGDMRELCGLCALTHRWDENGELNEVIQ